MVEGPKSISSDNLHSVENLERRVWKNEGDGDNVERLQVEAQCVLIDLAYLTPCLTNSDQAEPGRLFYLPPLCAHLVP